MKKNTEQNEKSDLLKFFEDQVADLYYAEKKILKALPKMEKAARSDSLAQALASHRGETEEHVSRLESVFEELGKPAKAKKCEAIEGILEEGQGILDEFKGKKGVDAAIIAAAQKVEHYEITGYGTLRAMAEQLGLKSIVKILASTLEEEKTADSKLTKISQTANRDAAELSQA